MKRVLLLFLTFSCIAKAQTQYHDFYKLIRQAKKHQQQNKLDSSLENFKQAFSLVDFVPKEYLNVAIKVSIKLKRNELKIAWQQKIKEQENQLDKEYANEINKLSKADQSIRNRKNISCRDKYYACLKGGNYSTKNIEKYKKALDRWSFVDSINIYTLLQLIKLKGFPSEQKVGYEAADNAFIIMLHFDDDKDNHILKPIIDEALYKGQILPRWYAWIIDRRKDINGQKPYYYFGPFAMEKLTNEERMEIDERREKIDYGKMAETQIIIKGKKYCQVKYLE